MYAAAVTPSRDDVYQMDISAALEVIDFLCERGIRGIALFGATGEFPHFSVEDRIRLAHLAIKRSRAPVLVNATHTSFADAVVIADHAQANGAAGLLLQPPYYFRYQPEEIREFFLRMADALNHQLPLFLYNLPAYGNAIPLEVATELLLSGRAADIKDSSGDWDYFSRLLEARRQKTFALLVGNDALLVRGRTAGADGVISGCACALPELLVALDAAVAAQKNERAATLARRLDEFLSWVDQFPGPLGVREALGVRGLKVGCRAVPLAAATERRAAQFREWFSGWLPVVLKEASET